jgi:hypothetical protein
VIIQFKRSRTPDYTEERVYKTLWHLACFGVGAYEFSTHKSKRAKFFAIGLMLFHLDAVVTDAFNLEKTISRQLLEQWKTRNL